jgi:hypothetical protein
MRARGVVLRRYICAVVAVLMVVGLVEATQLVAVFVKSNETVMVCFSVVRARVG